MNFAITKRIFSLIILLALPLAFYAQKARKVCGEYIYYVPTNQSLEQAKNIALGRAKIKALADEFGTIVSQTNSTVLTNENGKTDNRFFSLSGSEVKGEWLENDGEPQYEILYEKNMLIVKCSVCGKAREIKNSSINFKATILRNGTTERFTSSEFHDNDFMYLLFQTPVDGYVAVYLIDETPTAYCLLPYQNDSDGQQIVKHGKEYIFFSPEKASEELNLVDQYSLTCSGSVEHNQIYVIFSPNPFTKATDNAGAKYLPRQLSYKEFTEWLSNCRKLDPKMSIKVLHMEIRP